MAVVNRSDGTAEVNGVRLFGLDAEVHLKLEAKRDKDFEQQLGQWVATVVGQPLEHPDDVVESLKSGIMLCQLVNKIQPGLVPKINTRRIPLLEMENIGLYLKACWELGVPSEDLFVTSDLYLRKGVPQVFQNLQSLARIAQTRPSFKGPKFGHRVVEKRETKWTGIIKKQPITFITDIEENERRQQLYAQERKQVEEEKSDRGKDKDQLLASLDRERAERVRLEQVVRDLREEADRERQKAASFEDQLHSEKTRARQSLLVGKSAQGSARERELEEAMARLQEELAKERSEKEKERRMVSMVIKQLNQQNEATKRLESEGDELRTQLADMKRQLARMEEALASHAVEHAVEDEGDEDGAQAAQEEPLVRGNVSLLQSLKSSAKSGVRVRSLMWADPLKPRGLDDNMVEMLNKCTTKVLYSSSNVEFEHIMDLNKAFELDYGRRQFAFVLKQVIHRVPSLCLSTYAFDLMLYIFNRVLVEMDRASKKDYIGARVLKNAAVRLYRDENGLFVYLKDFVKEFKIWHDLQFWEEHFLDELAKKRKQLENDASEAECTTLAASLLAEFVRDMLTWNVEERAVRSFVKLMAQQNHLSDDERKAATAAIGGVVPSAHLPQPVDERVSMPPRERKSGFTTSPAGSWFKKSTTAGESGKDST